MSLPQNIPEALSNLTNLTDEIWHHAGDESTDVSQFYVSYELCVRNPTIWDPTRSDTNRPVQSQEMVRSLKIWI